MVLNEIIQRVQSLYSKGVQSDDTRLSPRHIYSKLLTGRSRLLVQKLNKKQKVSQWSYQTLPCIEMIEVELHDCDCLPLEFPMTRCKIFRSKYKIPSILTTYDRHNIQYVTSVDGQFRYSEISWESSKYSSYNKYTGQRANFYIKDSYLWITYNKMEIVNLNTTSVLTMSAQFHDPFKADNFISYCPNSVIDCRPFFEKSFPLDEDLIETLIDMTYKELVLEFNRNREDITNNTRDNGTK